MNRLEGSKGCVTPRRAYREGMRTDLSLETGKLVALAWSRRGFHPIQSDPRILRYRAICIYLDADVRSMLVVGERMTGG